MGRKYTSVFANVAILLPQDLVSLSMGGGGGIARILRAWLMATPSAIPAAQMLSVRARVLSGAGQTVGSGGSSGAADRYDQADAASQNTFLRNNDTVKATATNANIVYDGGLYIYQGIDIVFSEPIILYADIFVWELLSTPLASTTFSGGILWEEIGG
jgi:hypothetical protein